MDDETADNDRLYRAAELLVTMPEVRQLEEERAPRTGGRLFLHMVLRSQNATTISLRLYELDREFRRAVRVLQLDPELGASMGFEPGGRRRRSPISVLEGGLELRWAAVGSFEAVLQAYGQVETWGVAHPVLLLITAAAMTSAWNRGRRIPVAVFKRLRHRSEHDDVVSGRDRLGPADEDDFALDDRSLPILDDYERLDEAVIRFGRRPGDYASVEIVAMDDREPGPRIQMPNARLAVAIYAVGADGTVIVATIGLDSPTWT